MVFGACGTVFGVAVSVVYDTISFLVFLVAAGSAAVLLWFSSPGFCWGRFLAVCLGFPECRWPLYFSRLLCFLYTLDVNKFAFSKKKS